MTQIITIHTKAQQTALTEALESMFDIVDDTFYGEVKGMFVRGDNVEQVTSYDSMKNREILDENMKKRDALIGLLQQLGISKV